MLNRCPHQAGPLCHGKLWSALEASVPGEYKTSRDGETLTCRWHGWEFDIRTGQSWCDPERLRVRAYEVKVEPGNEIAAAAGAPAAGRAKWPYVAETYPVRTEGRYVVVDVGRRAGARPARPAPSGA